MRGKIRVTVKSWLGWLISLAVSQMFMSSAVFASYGDGIQAYQAGDYAKAIKLWSSERSPEALFSLGLMHSQGIGVTKNLARGAEFYQSAAESGSAHGQFNLGLAYYLGRGVDQDIGVAQDWWEQAAAQNHPKAQYNLASLLWQGTGQSDVKGHGKSVTKDQYVALYWFFEARENGSVEAKNFLRVLYDPLYQHLAQIKFDQSNESAIDMMGIFKLGLQSNAHGDYDKALRFWQPLADSGHLDAQYQIAKMHELGQGFDADFDKAFALYDRAAQKGHGDSQYRIGLFHLNESDDPSEALGLYWMQSAADNQSIEAADYMRNL